MHPMGTIEAATRPRPSAHRCFVAIAAGILALAVSSGPGSRARAGQETTRPAPPAQGEGAAVTPGRPEEVPPPKAGPGGPGLLDDGSAKMPKEFEKTKKAKDPMGGLPTGPMLN